MGMWLLPVGNSALHTIWIMHVISYFCDFLHVQETCGYELARNDCREVNGSSCGKNHLTSIRTFYCPIYCRSIRGQEPSFIRVVKLYGNFFTCQQSTSSVLKYKYLLTSADHVWSFVLFKKFEKKYYLFCYDMFYHRIYLEYILIVFIFS